MNEMQGYIIIAALLFIAAGLHKESFRTWTCFYLMGMIYLLLGAMLKVTRLFL